MASTVGVFCLTRVRLVNADGLAQTDPLAPRASLLQESLSITSKGCENNEYVTFFLLFSSHGQFCLIFLFFELEGCTNNRGISCEGLIPQQKEERNEYFLSTCCEPETLPGGLDLITLYYPQFSEDIVALRDG